MAQREEISVSETLKRYLTDYSIKTIMEGRAALAVGVVDDNESAIDDLKAQSQNEKELAEALIRVLNKAEEAVTLYQNE